MKVVLESTSKQVMINGLPCRIWEGQTAEGIALHAFVALIGTPEAEHLGEFDQSLNVSPAPRDENIAAYPEKLILAANQGDR